MHIDDNFENVVWTDEYSVQLETYRWFCCRNEASHRDANLGMFGFTSV